MAGNKDRLSAFCAQILNEISDLCDANRVKSICRLVQDQQLRVMENGIGNAKPLLHAKGIFTEQLFILIG